MGLLLTGKRPKLKNTDFNWQSQALQDCLSQPAYYKDDFFWNGEATFLNSNYA
jgi:hypothetical protein